MAFLSNYPYDELSPGLSTSIEREISAEDIERFAALSGDANPTHLDQAFARGTVFRGVVAHGMWSGLLISRVLGTVLPGPGTIYLRQSLKFERPVRPGDRLKVEVTVKEKRGRGRVLLVPNLEAGNLLVKQLTFTSGMDAAGIVLGARVPIVLTSRADSQRTRLASLALAKVVAAATAVGRFGGPRHAADSDPRFAEQP